MACILSCGHSVRTTLPREDADAYPRDDADTGCPPSLTRQLLLVDELRSAWRSESKAHRTALVAIFVIAAVLRASYLDQPMRYDEAVTWLHFASQPLADAVSLYTWPNNHVFHTVLVKLFASVGGPEPWVLRMPAFLAGIAAVPATYALGRVLWGGRDAVVGAALVAASGGLILYSANARGYTIVVLGFLLLALAAHRAALRPTPGSGISIAVIASLMLWTVPAALYPVAAVFIWLAWLTGRSEGHANFAPLLVTAVATALLTSVLYLPVVMREGAGSLLSNSFVEPAGIGAMLGGLPRSLVEALRSWTLGLPPTMAIALATGLLAGVVRFSGSRSASALAVSCLVASVALLLATRRAPFARVWLWAAPVVALFVASGLVGLFDRWPRSRALIRARTPTLAVALATLLGMFVLTSRSILASQDTGTFPAAETVAMRLSGELREGDRIVVAIPTSAPLQFHLRRLGVPSSRMDTPPGEATRLVVVVDRRQGQTLEALVPLDEIRAALAALPTLLFRTDGAEVTALRLRAR